MTSTDDWIVAYARQADADFDTWEVLEQNQSHLKLPDCHKLMFLQMACEKLTKAHLCSHGSSPKELQSSHAYTAKNLHIIIREQARASSMKSAVIKGLVTHAKHLAQEICFLAPAVKRGGQRLDNCEYPWEDNAGRLHVPRDWTFTPSALLTVPAGRTFLKLVRSAINSLL